MTETPPDRDPDALAESLEAEVADMERHSEEVGEEIDDAKADWEKKRADSGVPGAPPPVPEATELEDENPAEGQGGPMGGG